MVAKSFMRKVVGPTVEVNYFRKIYNCMLDDQVAAQNSDNGRRNPTCFSELRGRLDTRRFKLPPLYHENVHKSCIDNLDKLGETGFNQILLRPPRCEACLMMDIAQAILQHGGSYSEKATVKSCKQSLNL